MKQLLHALSLLEMFLRGGRVAEHEALEAFDVIATWLEDAAGKLANHSPAARRRVEAYFECGTDADLLEAETELDTRPDEE